MKEGEEKVENGPKSRTAQMTIQGNGRWAVQTPSALMNGTIFLARVNIFSVERE